jgi:hypothetical protein
MHYLISSCNAQTIQYTYTGWMGLLSLDATRLDFLDFIFAFALAKPTYYHVDRYSRNTISRQTHSAAISH